VGDADVLAGLGKGRGGSGGGDGREGCDRDEAATFHGSGLLVGMAEYCTVRAKPETFDYKGLSLACLVDARSFRQPDCLISGQLINLQSGFSI
jgi:hypothetical protein